MNTFDSLPKAPRSKGRLIVSGLAVVAVALLAACSTSQARPQVRTSVAADPTSRQALTYYQAQLAELPLRMKHYDLSGVQAQSPVVIREMHVIHDDVRDEILVIDHDNKSEHMWSIDPNNFTLHWRTPINKRVAFKPLATRNYVVLMDTDGSYQAFDRLAGPRNEYSRLVAKGRYEGDIFPSAHPACNDSHLFLPATNSNSMRGISLISNARGVGAETWSYPATNSTTSRFEQIALPPAADRESVVFINNNNLLYMVDAQTGEFRASPDLERNSRTPPVLHDDMVFAGSDRGQLFAFLKSGEAAFVVPTRGLPTGDIFVEDRWVYLRTLEIFENEVATDDGKGKRLRADTRAGLFCAYQYKYTDVPGDRPVISVVDGDTSTPWVIDPIWTEPDVGQRVLMKNGDHLYVLYEEKEPAFGTRELAKLRSEGRIVKKEEEFRTVSRTLKIIDTKTGKLVRPDWVYNLADFAFVTGSMFERDRAIYFGTLDGYVFRCYASGTGNAGGR